MNSYLNSNAIIWKSEYNISNFKIDKEHQKLFTIAREAMNVSKLKNDKEVKNKLKEIITKLFDYVGTHFSNEQKYVSPDLVYHNDPCL